MYYLNRITFVDGSQRDFAIEDLVEECLEDDEVQFLNAWQIDIRDNDYKFINMYGIDINKAHIITNQTLLIIDNDEYIVELDKHRNELRKKGING